MSMTYLQADSVLRKQFPKIRGRSDGTHKDVQRRILARSKHDKSFRQAMLVYASHALAKRVTKWSV